MNPGLGGHQYPETHKLELLKVKREGSSTLLSTGKKLSQDINWNIIENKHNTWLEKTTKIKLQRLIYAFFIFSLKRTMWKYGPYSHGGHFSFFYTYSDNFLLFHCLLID